MLLKKEDKKKCTKWVAYKVIQKYTKSKSQLKWQNVMCVFVYLCVCVCFTGSCHCGQCICSPQEWWVSGEYCECDDRECDKHDGLICTGNETHSLDVVRNEGANP